MTIRQKTQVRTRIYAKLSTSTEKERKNTSMRKKHVRAKKYVRARKKTCQREKSTKERQQPGRKVPNNIKKVRGTSNKKNRQPFYK